MAGRHAAKSTSKKPVIITVVAVLVIAAIAAVILFMNNNGGSSDSNSTQPSTVATTQAVQESTEPVTEAQTDNNLPDHPPVVSEQPAEFDDDEHETEAIDIAIPTEEGSEISYFNSSYIPNGEVVDISTGANVTIREVFGSAYPGGVLTFNDDGTFTDTLSASGVDSGAYLVENGQIKATYVSDRNMDITVTDWNGDVPSAFYIIYGNGENGFKVFFSEN